MKSIDEIASRYEIGLHDFLVLSAVAKGPESRSALIKTVMWLRIGWKELDNLSVEAVEKSIEQHLTKKRLQVLSLPSNVDAGISTPSSTRMPPYPRIQRSGDIEFTEDGGHVFDRISNGVAPEEEFNPCYYWVESSEDGSRQVKPHMQATVIATSEEYIATALRHFFVVTPENIEAKQVGRHALIREFWWQMPVRGAEYHVTFDRKPVAPTVIIDLLVALMWDAKHGNGRAAKRVSFYLEKGTFSDEIFVSSVKEVWPEIRGPEWKSQLAKVLGS